MVEPGFKVQGSKFKVGFRVPGSKLSKAKTKLKFKSKPAGTFKNC
jgi:hypothetical protein